MLSNTLNCLDTNNVELEFNMIIIVKDIKH